MINTLLGLNKVIWSRAVPEDILGIIISSGIAITLMGIFNSFIAPMRELPAPMLLFIGIVTAMGFIAARYRWRLLADFSAFWMSRRNTFSAGERVLIMGAGDGSELACWVLRREIFRQAFTIIGLVDDDPLKQGMRYDGAWVIGTSADITHIVKKHDVGLIMLAMTNISSEERQRMLKLCSANHVRLVWITDMMNSLQQWLKHSPERIGSD
jgi:FlaA1/EpsC-like NDP-sugar epimerase